MVKEVITINDKPDVPLLAARVFDEPCTAFLDTGARVNIISFDFLRKCKPGVVVLEPAAFSIRGVTGNKLLPKGETQITVIFDNYYMFDINVVVVDQKSFPGDLLIGYDTMRDEDITIIPASGGVNFSYKFLPFINSCSHDIAAPVSQSLMTANDTATPLNNVAERYSLRSPPTPNSNINTEQQNQHQTFPTPPQPKTTSETLEIVPGSVTESTLLQAQSICRVKVQLKGKRDHVVAIALPESSRVRGITLECGLYNTHKGKSEVIISNTLHTDITLRKGTQLGCFQVSKTIEEIDDSHFCDANEPIENVCALQESESSEEDIKQHLAPTSRPDLEGDLVKLLMLHKAAVALPGDALGKTTLLQHKIKLKPGTQPIYVPAYRLPHSRLATVDKLVADMLSQDVIESSDSEWNFPLILVPKPDGTMRPVIDYRKLNEQTIPDRLPLPVISDILQSLGTKNKLFSTIDIKSAFWQIELDEASRPLTAFSTPSGHYQFRRMPFGLSNSPLTYVRLMNTVLHGLIGNTASVFLDDILIVSETEEEHFHKLNQVFSRLAAAGLKVKLEKCRFLQEQVTYLGHQIDSQGLKTVQSKVDVVKHFPTPTSVEKVRSFLGLTGYYRKFIKGYADIAQPLSSLLKKNAEFTWGPTQIKAFDTLKEKLTSSPVLILPDYTQEFILATDASDIGLGGVLMQERNGAPQPIAYASRLCTAAERNYSITERETLAVIYSLEKFRDIILGYPIRVWTDHTAIQNLFKHKNLRGRLARWFVTLQNYEVKFEYIPGKKNTAADALSRNAPSPDEADSIVCSIQELTTLDSELVRSEQGKDDIWQQIIEHLESNAPSDTLKLPKKYKLTEFHLCNGLLYRDAEINSKDVSRGKVKQLVVPSALVPVVLNFIHNCATSSHPGKEKAYRQAQLKYYWPDMRKQIYNHIDNCHTCIEVKGHTRTPAPMLNYPIPEKPWERVHLDTLELPLSENGFKYLLVIIDYFSRFCILHPIMNKKAETIATTLFERVICPFTTPKTIITDNGPEFNNAILTEICKLFNIKKVNIHAYKPESNGVVERLNRKIITCLRTLINPHSISWDTWIPHVTCALNTQLSSATGDTPHYIIFGEDKTLPYALLESEPRRVYNYDDFVLTRVNKFKEIYQRVRDHMQQYSQEMTKQQHKRARDIKIQSDDIVMVKLHTPIGNSNKLSPQFKGPYKVIAPDSGNKFKIRHLETGDISIRHADELKLTHLKDYVEHKETPDTVTPVPSTHPTGLDNENYAHKMKLRSHSKQALPCTVENLSETEFYNHVDDILNELNIDCFSFYR